MKKKHRKKNARRTAEKARLAKIIEKQKRIPVTKALEDEPKKEHPKLLRGGCGVALRVMGKIGRQVDYD